jgi:hypothetical protein
MNEAALFGFRLFLMMVLACAIFGCGAIALVEFRRGAWLYVWVMLFVMALCALLLVMMATTPL